MTGDELGRAPIRPEAPAGEDIRDQDIFLNLQSEMNRSQTVTSGASTVVDWTAIRKMASSILETKSKDLLVGAYLSVALARTNGPAGAVEGIAVLNGMVADHWDGLFPPLARIRARRNAFTWWMAQMQEILPALTSPALTPDEMERGKKGIRELNGTLGEKDPDGPSLSPLYPFIEGLPVSLPAAPPPPAPEPSAASSPAPSSSSSSNSGASSPAPNAVSIPEEGDPVLVLEQISPALLALSDRLFEADPGDSRSLALSRMILWEGIRELPASEGGTTRIPAPPPHILSALEAQLGSGSEEGALRFLLGLQSEYPFWFDLSFRAGSLLEGRGPEGAGGAESLRGALRSLVARLPGIETLSFSGGDLPFLSPEGRSWIAKGSGGGEGEEEGEGKGKGSALLSKVRSALADGRVFDGCTLFEEIRRKEASPRGRFLLNLEFLGLVEPMGREFPVLALSQALLEEIEKNRLDLWEPSLAARAYPTIIGIFQTNGDEALRLRAMELSVRLAALDIAGSVKLFQNAR